MKTLYFECNMGAAGDMLMAALYEICEQKESFLASMNEAFAPFGVSVSAERAVKCGISGTHMSVLVHGAQEDADADHEIHACVTGHSHDTEYEIATGCSHDTEHGAATGHSHNTEHGAITGHSHDTEHGVTTGHSHDTENGTHTGHAYDADETMQTGGSHGIDAATQTGRSLGADDTAHAVHSHTDYPSVLANIGALPLPAEVKKDAEAIYRLIGEAEAKVHGTELSHIHFHEVGTLDALADVVGCALLIHLIAPEQILSSPVHVGSGFVHCAHGILPVPAPACAELLRGIPCYTGAVAGELCTPTGAAILKHFVTRFVPMPPLTVHTIGYGMGTKDFAAANCVRVFWGVEYKEDPDESFPCDDLVLSISCNVDDMTGEAIGLATEIFMAAGALDVYTIPVQMKKNRPGILLTCICKPDERDKFTGLFFLHTSTRGVRYQTYNRAKLESKIETRRTAYGDIRVKKSSGYGIEKEKPEFEDLKSVVLKNQCALSLTDVAKSLHH